MASSWTKSLHCNSTAIEDVHLPKKSLSLSLSCTKSPQIKSPKPKSKSPNPKSKNLNPFPPPPPPPLSLPTLIDLPQGHSSRRILEIIFASSWPPPSSAQIEMLFRVHYPPLYVARFEDHRSAVRSRSDDPRCAADGNEMMRFHPSVAASGGIYNAGVLVCSLGQMKGVRTFSGSGGAHDFSGDGLGRRAMLVCRVIAGRVVDLCDFKSEADSVRVRKGELLVFDPRAVLPCFLIIYKISPQFTRY